MPDPQLLQEKFVLVMSDLHPTGNTDVLKIVEAGFEFCHLAAPVARRQKSEFPALWVSDDVVVRELLYF